MTPKELKNSIFQLAIQGKLVEQRPEEGTAEELYKQIQADKKRLIQVGVIKKEQSLPEITEDEKPFDIPESWKWVRLRTIVYNRGQEVPSALFSYIDIGSIDNKNQRLNTEENLINADNAPSRARKIVKLGDILYSTVRPYLHNMCIIDRQFSCKPIASTGFAAMTCFEGIYNRYLFNFLMSPAFDSYANHTENAKGVAYPAINDDRLYRAIVPLPPLAEQKRIFAKIEGLLPYIDRYEQAWSKLENFNKRFPTDMQKSILQTAIQGKLVEQRPEEGTGEELYQQIQAKKQKLIKAGIIKKDKPLPEITEDEKPFDIPESWKWVPLQNVALVIVDCPHSTPTYYEHETKYHAIDTTCIDSNGAITGWRNVDEPTYESRISRLQPQYNDIIYTREGSICRAAILPNILKICLGQRVMLIRCSDSISPEFMKRLLMAPQTVNSLTAKQRGIGAKHVNVSDVCSLTIPLPPFAEQKRILAMLDMLLPMCDKLKRFG